MLSELLILSSLSLILFGIAHSMYKGNINWLHSYHRKRIEEKDYSVVGKWCGIGLYLIGIGILVMGILLYLGKEKLSSYVLIPFLAIGIGINLYVIIKYNKGLF